MAATRRGKGRGGKRPPPAETAYERRIRVYMERHPGATRQEARGKGPAARRGGEHRERVARERAVGGLTTDQRQAVKRFALKLADRMGGDPDDIIGQMQDWAQRHGWGAFVRYRDQVRELTSQTRRITRRFLREGGQLPSRSANRALMEQLAEDWELPEWRWLFYH